jgi:hypothetical protein
MSGLVVRVDVPEYDIKHVPLAESPRQNRLHECSASLLANMQDVNTVHTSIIRLVSST